MKRPIDAFRELFPDTPEGYAKMTDGMYYNMFSRLYVYHFKEHINSIKALLNMKKDKLKYPEDAATPDADELMKMTAHYLVPKLASRETSGYHGKVMRLDDIKKILSLNVDINLPTLPETIIPYAKAKDLILNNPDHLCVLECPCRSTKEDGCWPRETCIMIGEPIVSFVIEHNKEKRRRITQQEALEIIQAEHERGHVQTAYFKDAMGDRFYCICNCCKCCCTSMAAHRFGIPMMTHSGYTRVNSDKCTGCGECAEHCPFDAISISEDSKAVVDQNKCMGCGVCEVKCKHGAVNLILNPEKGEPFDLDKILTEDHLHNK